MAAKKPLHGEVPDGRGQHKVVPISDFRKQAYLDWLCTPTRERNPRKLEDLAHQLQVTRRTLTNWRDDKEFLEAWEKRYLKTIGDPSRKSEIMNTLYRTATDADDPRHVAAAKQYFEIEGSLKPMKMQVEVSAGEPRKLTDEELDDLLSRKVHAEREQRGIAS